MSSFNGDLVQLTNLGTSDVAGNGPGAGTGLGVLIITILTISFQTVKAAMANPIKSIKYE